MGTHLVTTGSGTAVYGMRRQTFITPSQFSPADIPGLQFDLNPDVGMYSDAGTTLAINGGTVQQANDQSGQGHAASQATSGKRPLWRTNIVNGHAVIEFDGVNDDVKTAPFTLNQPVTVFLVAKILDATEPSVHNFIDGNGIDSMAGYWVAGTAQWRTYAGTDEVVGGTTDTTAFHVLEAVFNGASSLAKVDGNTGATGNTGANNPGGVTLGADAGEGGHFGNYQLARGLVYAGALTVAQRTQLRRYLGTLYTVTVA